MSALLATLRRELLAYLRSPVAWIVATLFLLVQGYGFWLLVNVLSASAAPATWPMRYFFGGGFLFWLFVMLMSSLITMRLVAEERRLGTIEPLLTSPASAASIVVGKYLAALGWWTLLWAPTGVYVILLARLAPSGIALDAGPIAAGYFGTLLVGAAALAIGLLASTLTQHQLLAVMLGFMAQLGVLLAGGAASVATPGSTAQAVLERMSVLRHMEDFARGVVDSRALVWSGGLAIACVWASVRLVERPTLAARARRRALSELIALFALVVLANVAASRHYRRWDWTRAGANTLAPRTIDLLKRVDKPVSARLLMLPTGRADDAFPLTRDLLALYAARAPLFSVEVVDPDRDPDRVRALAAKWGMSGDELQEGAVVVESGERSRYVPRHELIETEVAPDGGTRLKSFRGEAAIDGALLGVIEGTSPTICFTRGHGELRIDDLSVDGASDWGEALKRSGDTLRTLTTLDARSLAGCAAIVSAGPVVPFTEDEVKLLDDSLAQGGRLVVLLGGSFGALCCDPRQAQIEPMLERHGVQARQGIGLVLDPDVQMSTSSLAFAVERGYADHPITRALMGQRTVWALTTPLTIVAAPGHHAVDLVHTSERGHLELPPGVLPEHIRGASGEGARSITIAVAIETDAHARLVVLGSRAIARNDHDVYFNRDLLEASVAWAAGSERTLDIAPRAASELKLAPSQAELDRVLWVCVVGMPLFCVLCGLGVWWRRRR